MFNLRQLNEEPESSTNSDAQHFSRFSIANFRIPSDRLGNIGEPLDYGASLRLQEEAELNDAGITEVDQDGVPFGILGEREDDGEPVAGPSATRWDDIESGIANSSEEGSSVPREKQLNQLASGSAPVCWDDLEEVRRARPWLVESDAAHYVCRYAGTW